MIRFATENDLSAMLAIYRPYVENTTYSFEYDTPCLRTFTQRFYDHVAQFPWLVYEEAGVVLGYAYAGAPWERAAYRWCAEVSIYLHPSVHGRGIGQCGQQTAGRTPPATGPHIQRSRWCFPHRDGRWPAWREDRVQLRNEWT